MKEFIYSTSTNPYVVLLDFLNWQKTNDISWEDRIIVVEMVGDEESTRYESTVINASGDFYRICCNSIKSNDSQYEIR